MPVLRDMPVPVVGYQFDPVAELTELPELVIVTRFSDAAVDKRPMGHRK